MDPSSWPYQLPLLLTTMYLALWLFRKIAARLEKHTEDPTSARRLMTPQTPRPSLPSLNLEQDAPPGVLDSPDTPGWELESPNGRNIKIIHTTRKTLTPKALRHRCSLAESSTSN